MSDEQGPFELLTNAQFVIGGEDKLAALRSKYPSEPQDEQGKRRLSQDWERLLSDLHIHTGTLLKTDTVSFLLGAGASRECGGPLISTIPVILERELLSAGITADAEPQISTWIEAFYAAAARVGGESVSAPTNRAQILDRRVSM